MIAETFQEVMKFCFILSCTTSHNITEKNIIHKYTSQKRSKKACFFSSIKLRSFAKARFINLFCGGGIFEDYFFLHKFFLFSTIKPYKHLLAVLYRRYFRSTLLGNQTTQLECSVLHYTPKKTKEYLHTL